MQNRFDKETHTYYINEIPVPSITQLIPKQEFFVSSERLEETRKEGEDNHSLIKMYLDTEEIFNEPMLFALDILLKEKEKEFGKKILWETPLYSTRHLFAGTADLIMENAIIDFKRSFSNKYYHSLQLAGQYILSQENNIIPDTKNWHIAFYQNSKFKLKPVYHPDAKTMFLKLVDKYYIDQSINKYLKGEVDG